MTNPAARLHGLDALRGGMMLLGIVLHAAFFHLVTALAADTAPSPFVLGIIGVIHQFRMPLFFVLAGFFMALLVERDGPAAALSNRARRLLLPLLLCLPSILPLTLWLWFSLFLSAQEERLALVTPGTDLPALLAFMRERGVGEPVTLFHLWFLYYLCLYCTGAVLMRGLLRKLGVRKPPAALAHPLMILPLSVMTALTLLPFPGAVVTVSDPPFVPDPAALGYHGVFFMAGYVFRQLDALQLTFTRHAGKYATLAAMTTALFAALYFLTSTGGPVRRVAGISLAALSTWSFIYCLCGLGLGRWNRDIPFIRLLSQSAYWVYLLHMPVILFIGLMLDALRVPLVPALLLNMGLTAAICLWTWRAWGRGTWLGTLLNGRRYDGECKDVEFRRACAS